VVNLHMVVNLHNDGPCDRPVQRPDGVWPHFRLAALVAALRRHLQTHRRDRQRLAMARHIERLNDHLLRDIGLDRSEISNGGQWRGGPRSRPKR
jgi:uncharacterized protein YjiS (DUF1127 family)